MSTLPARSPVPEDFVTVAEAAALLRVAPSTIRRWIRQGTVPAYRIGPRRVALKRGELSALVSPTAAGDGGRGMVLRGEDEVRRRLTPEEQRRGLAALEQAERLSRELLARNGGQPFPSSVDIIHEMREERTRELTERRS